jgi:hypothetical protein
MNFITASKSSGFAFCRGLRAKNKTLTWNGVCNVELQGGFFAHRLGFDSWVGWLQWRRKPSVHTELGTNFRPVYLFSTDVSGHPCLGYACSSGDVRSQSPIRFDEQPGDLVGDLR